MNFQEELNEEQLAAVTAPDGPALVVAAAGTGKTRTLIYRLAYLATEKNVQPWEVLLLTFTNKAAKEMLSRAEALVQRRFNSGYSGTFHSFANRLLRSHADSIGFGKDFTILDADDAKKLMRACIDELDVEKKHFPKPEVLLSLFGVVSGRMGDLSAAVDERFEYTEVDADQVLKAHARYQARKKDSNAMDFDDLLIHAHKLLAEHEKIRSFYQDEFKYVLVDEYQDTNAIQAELVHLLVKAHGNLMVVGDDFQSIYSWRGADFRNFLDFDKAYPEAKTFKLQINYRSTPEILDVANEVIAGNPEQFQKELQAVRENGAMPHLAKLRDGSMQARYVIGKAQELNRQGIPLSEICVLYRSHFHAMELQMELAREQMQYIVTSGVRFFEQAHVKDVCTVLRLLVNPSDELAFSRLVEMFPKVGKKTSHKIFRKLGGRVNLQREETHEQLIA
ncbi:MAG: ATP-dependent helicase, partial [Verrucomicrobiota bacterium]